MMTEEYREFLEKKVSEARKSIERGDVYSHEEVWERAMRAIVLAEKNTQDAAQNYLFK